MTVNVDFDDHDGAFDAALDSSGRIVVLSSVAFAFGGRGREIALFRVLPHGALDIDDFGGGIIFTGVETALSRALAIQPDGGIITGGSNDDFSASLTARFLPS
jgi:hypothetical protein